MNKNAPAVGAAGGAKRVLVEVEANTDSTDSAPPRQDLHAFRARLVAARARLVERIADDFPADRRFPDSGWTRLLADIQAAIAAVDAVVAEGGP